VGRISTKKKWPWKDAAGSSFYEKAFSGLAALRRWGLGFLGEKRDSSSGEGGKSGKLGTSLSPPPAVLPL